MGGFLRMYQSYQTERGMRPDAPIASVRRCQEKVPELFKLLWQHRHYILPLPGEDVPRWKLSLGYVQDTSVNRLEFALVYFMGDFEWVFGEAP